MVKTRKEITMYINSQLGSIVQSICTGFIGQSLDELENYLLSHPSRVGMDKFVEIKNDYQLMSDYWRRGFADPQRSHLYRQLLHRLYELTVNIMLHEWLSSGNMQPLYKRPRILRTEWSVASIKKDLESYVADSVMLELEPQHIQQTKRDELNFRHQELMRNIFDYIVTSHIWKDSLCEAFVDLLMSTTVDVNDQLLIVSAISLSQMNVFDINKFKVLTTLYVQSTDVQVRQRALVGWALSLDEKVASLYPEMGDIVKTICQDENYCKELTELQMQMYYCKDTENDQRTIRDEIMPDLINGSKLKISKKGIEELDEDTLEDILHPEESERNMEKMESSLRRMADMQKQGTDIYYEGFKQMKRFTFFLDICNWFIPFTPNHPSISHIWNNAKGSKMLHRITTMGSFCDSDKYSFVLAFEQVRNQLPPHMVEMIEKGEAAPMPVGGEVPAEERQTPAFVRRMYLQNLYRFCHLYNMRGEFPNPFERMQSYRFFDNALFKGTLLSDHLQEVASFLIKRNHLVDALSILNTMPEEKKSYQYHLMLGSLTHRLGSMATVTIQLFRKALEMKPDDEKAMAGLARALFSSGNYDEAIEYYERLLLLKPDSKNYTLSLAYSLINVNRHEEAKKHLYKLQYLYPEDQYVNRGLAQVLTSLDQFEQAEKLYEQLTTVDNPQSDDLLDYGFCLWFAHKIDAAVNIFKQYVKNKRDTDADLDKVFLTLRADQLSQHHISPIEIHMMLDAVLRF